MEPKVKPELVFKYVDGNCTPEEVAAIHKWYHAIEIKQDPFKDLNEVEEEAYKMLMFNRFKNTITVNENNNAWSSRRGSMWRYTVSGIAALLLIAIGINLVTKKRAGGTNASIVKELVMVNNMTNSFYKKILSDGSTVWLSPKSSLAFPEKFSGPERRVKMSGSAFFEVSKDQVHPFIIYSGGLITRVWGTSFRINACQGQPTEVSVVTGKVSVKLPEKDGSEVMLLPAQKVTRHPNEASFTLEEDQSNSDMRIWQKTSMKFKNTRVDSLLKCLNEHFNVHIYTKKKHLEAYTIKADFTDLNLAEILEILQASLNVGYNMKGINVELY
jgi:transmembrane sensor